MQRRLKKTAKHFACYPVYADSLQVDEPAEAAGSMLERDKIELFILAGNATLTLRNTTTGNRFTYRVRQCDDKPELYFVSVLTGSDNTSDYQYLGTLRSLSYAHGRKSRIASDATSARAFAWFWEHRHALPACVEVWHEGRCGRCSRLLTVPESIASGFGPECIKHVDIAPVMKKAVGW